VWVDPPRRCFADILSLLNQLSPGDDAMLSHTYSLLNYIAATSRFSGVDDMGETMRGADGQNDYATLHSVESALRGLTEEEKRLIAVSTISVVSRLAVEFEEDEVWFRFFVPILMV
jgi:phosphatidylinositol 4-kinase